MYAIIETGGKQYKVEPGDEIFVEKLGLNEGDTLTFDKVFAVGDSGDLRIGNPLLKAEVSATVIKNGKGKKIRIFKMKPKKGYRRRKGHRQPYTKVKIDDIKA